jgi:hypothetical protein
MKVLKHNGMAVAFAATALSFLTLLLCSAWFLNSTSLAQSLALTAMSVCGSGVIALMEFRAPAPVRCRANREALSADCNLLV